MFEVRGAMKCTVWLLAGFALPVSTFAQPDPSWNPDADVDGAVSALDLLELLGVYGRWSRYVEPAKSGASARGGDASCGEVDEVMHRGHRYATVGIAGRCWFAENLRTDGYRNGDPIPSGFSSGEWLSDMEGGQCIYGEGDSRVYSGSADVEANYAAFGRLYNWYAVDDWRGVCPSGWHVPSDAEWQALADGVGGVDQTTCTLSDSGFQPVLGGGRNYGGFYGSAGVSGIWWSSTGLGSIAWFWRYDADEAVMLRVRGNRGMGASVRCIRD